MSRVIVLGSEGMAGHMVATYLSGMGHDVIRTVRALNNRKLKVVDATQEDELAELLNTAHANVIVNCVGILLPDAEKSHENTVLLNSVLPHRLSELGKHLKVKVIHLSTDCVFSGLNAPYREDSPYDGQLFYDRSKALGELKNDRDLTFRMSIIGPELKDGSGLFNWFMKQKEVTGFDNAIWNGITTLELARAINAAIDQDLIGLYHLVPQNGGVSKFELLGLLSEVFKECGIKVSKGYAKVETDKTLVNTRKDFKFEVKDYWSMLTELKQWMLERQHLYRQYMPGAEDE